MPAKQQTNFVHTHAHISAWHVPNAQRTAQRRKETMTTERLQDHQDSFEAVSRDNVEVSFTSGVEEIEENEVKIAEHLQNTEESTESWRDEAADVSTDVPTVLSSQEAAPSVTPERKNELLLQARADRISWVQAVPLPYQVNSICTDVADTNDPWSQNDCLASLLKDSNAVQSLPCIPQVLSSLYGAEQGITTDMAERIRTKVSFGAAAV